MPKERSPSYTPAPAMPSDPAIQERFATIVKVLAGQQTVAGAARSLCLSRNHFQTIFHRTMAVMLDELTPKPGGRPPRPERELALEEENRRLKKELAAMQAHAEIIERMMGAVSEIASGRMRSPRSQPRSRNKKPTTEDPEPAPTPPPAPTLPQVATTMREQGVPTSLSARALGVSCATVRRHAAGVPRGPRSSRAKVASEAERQRARTIVRETHGAVGADGLRRATGLSRRQCARIKRHELREMELERKARCAGVTIRVPGIVRGFDAMHVWAGDVRAYWLVAADASIPYRTSIRTVPTYDAEQVIAALIADFETHGRPLVLRLDRIACQRTPEVYAVLDHYEVLPLHGPPRYPRYYGQLERQNREHRAWLHYAHTTSLADLAEAGARMRTALNTLWPRPSLDGWTPEQAWRARAEVDVDRQELRNDVERRTTHLIAGGFEPLRARRHATESALQERGLLIINRGAAAR